MTIPLRSPQELLRLMRPWFPVIERGAFVALSVRDGVGYGFELTATWKNGRQHKKQYSALSISMSKLKRPCDHAKEFLRELLELRGAM